MSTVLDILVKVVEELNSQIVACHRDYQSGVISEEQHDTLAHRLVSEIKDVQSAMQYV